jgi:protein-S-isoprenylcysteine O-methyltransferase Ste14
MKDQRLSQGELVRLVGLRLAMALPVLIALLFLPAGTFAYWPAWVYLLIILVPMSFVLIYLLRNDPELLERRMRTRERQAAQKWVVGLSLVYFLVVFTLPGLDYRNNWSNVPAAVIIAADVIVLLGYGLIFLVFRENSYASRTVQVDKDQKVIRTGVYSLVRHPMYLGVAVMYIFSPLALGSYWAMLPALLIIPILVARIRDEENVLARELKGYPEYMQQTRYHLVPGIW